MTHKQENPPKRVLCKFLVLKNFRSLVLGVPYYLVQSPVLFRITL